MSNKIFCSKCNEKIAVWLYMPGYSTGNYLDDYICDDCVSRGCSCNNERINDYGDDIEELELQINEFKKNISTHNYYLINYGKKEHYVRKEIEIIKDKNLIKDLIYNSTVEQWQHYTFVPLDENMREFTCCEYEYDKDGFDYYEEEKV